jgi:diguanylate cyclase (GGDEF)-like protein
VRVCRLDLRIECHRADRRSTGSPWPMLQVVVDAIRTRLRSFDPIVRYGGDEFVCGLSGTDIDEASRRFDAIADAIKEEAGVGISVGFAALAAADNAEDLTQRADAAMLEVKASHHSRR